MIKNTIRNILQKFNYDIVKIDSVPNLGKYRVKSSIKDLDLFDTPTGKFYLPSFLPEDVVSITIQKGDIFDLHIIELAKKYLKNGEAALDVGANYGQMSILFANIVGESGEVYSFEAEPFVFEILHKNIEINRHKNIKAIFGAVHNKDGVDLIFPEPDFVRFKAYGSYGLDMQATEGRKIKSVTIDSLQINKPIGFMKIDVQGADLFAMQGAKETILKYKMPIVFEFEQQFQKEFGTSFQDYVDFVESINYKFEETIEDINFLILPR